MEGRGVGGRSRSNAATSSTAGWRVSIATALLTLGALALAGPARAADPPPVIQPAAPADSTPAPDAPAKADPAALEPLAFMAGCWEGKENDTLSEECWLAPAAGLMVGMHRDVFPNGRTMFEFLRIEAQPGGVVYLASPRGTLATPFKLVRAAGGRAEFANPMHDYPKRIIYWADGRDRLKAAVEGPRKGKPHREEWTWTRKR